MADIPSSRREISRADWLRGKVKFSGRECLVWPFSRMANGYAYISFEGKGMAAHRVMCILAHGNPPSTDHEAAHSCGKGHEGCVNPQHLRWATRSENNLDKIDHGTIVRGQEVSNAKLTEDAIREIRLLIPKVKNALIAERFGVSPATISEIKHRKVWAWVQ